MYLIIRDSATNADVKIDSLTGFVTGAPVDREFLGTPLSERQPGRSGGQPAQNSASIRDFVLPSK